MELNYNAPIQGPVVKTNNILPYMGGLENETTVSLIEQLTENEYEICMLCIILNENKASIIKQFKELPVGNAIKITIGQPNVQHELIIETETQIYISIPEKEFRFMKV